MWSLCHNNLPTLENLCKRKLLPDPLDLFCRQFLEMIEHLFFLCNWTNEISLDLRMNLQISNLKISKLDKWVMEFMQQKPTFPSVELLAAVLWSMWKARHSLIFQSCSLDRCAIINQVVQLDREFMRCYPGAKIRMRRENSSGAVELTRTW